MPLHFARFTFIAEALQNLVVVADLARLHAPLSPLLSEIRQVVQPARHIAAPGEGAGTGPRLAFMDPESAGAP